MKLSKFFSKIFNRVTLTCLVVLVQVVWLLSWFFGWIRHRTVFAVLLTLLSVLMALYIIRKDENPAYKISWIVIIGLVPLLGGLLYLLFGNKRPTKAMRGKLERIRSEHYAAMAENTAAARCLPSRLQATSNYLASYGPYPAWQNTASEYFSSGEALFARVLEDMERAERFLFVEFFIVSRGSLWDEVFAVLQRKAAAGVDVRVIFDDMGSAMDPPPDLAAQLERSGIRCLPFNPMVPLISFAQNHRAHRKFVIIDGTVGYTGGINLADEYVNRKQRFGYWKDTGVRLEGDAVWNMTVAFLNLWNAFRPTESDYGPYRPANRGAVPSDGIVQPYTDSPLDDETVAENVYLDILAQAQRYVYIFTPYLIIDNEMTTALTLAAKRGVDVRIVTPGIPDKPAVFRLTRSYYATLLRAGVRIYEYSPGFLHAKSFLCDDRLAVVGSINMDYRSLYLHFEAGVLLMECSLLQQMKQDYQQTFAESRPVTLSECRRSFLGQLGDDLLRLLSPLM